MLDALGLPDQLGDMIGAQIDAAKGDWAGYARNMQDLTSGLGTDQVDKMFGRGLPGSQFVPRPFDQIAKSKQLWSQTFHTPFGEHQISREKLGKGLFGNIKGRALEAAAMSNPAFKAALEAKLGGRIILDGRADGKITVERFRPHFGNLPFSNQIANNPMLSGIYGGLARLEGQLKELMEQMGGGGAQKSGGANAIQSGGTGGTGGVDTNDKETQELAQGMGMDMANLSFEDLLFLMMMKYARKKEKEILNKMNELSGKGGQGGLGGFGNFLGGVCQLGGTVLGGLYGGFPLGTMIGGQLGSAVGGMFRGGAGGAGGPFGGQAESDTLKQMQMQKLMEDLKKMYEMLSNVMKSMSDMQMAAVRNLR
jgi:hypothetical protein